MALDGAKFICLSDAAAADATEATPTATTGVEAGGIGDASTSENVIIEAKGRKFTVGYYMNCDYVLEDPRAIGVHCEIQCDAFGRVTIHNNSEAHPISVNEQIIKLKRPLLDGSRIQILDRIFLWKFPKSLEASATNKSTQGVDVTNKDTVSTPQKLVAVPEQAPNSCPDLKHHRKVDKRFTVHNFAYCINSDEEGNISSELPVIINESERTEEASTSELVTQKETNKNKRFEEMSVEDKEILPTSSTSQDSADGKITLETLNAERRSITPEPQKNEPIIASTPLIKLENTPKMNLINYTQNKQNKSTEKKLRLLSFCQQSDVVITSFSPRETGVRIEKSFTAVIKPTTICTISTSSTTPKSVYSTPKSMLSDYNDGESRDFIDFSTPATSKKAARVLARNSSMHLIDLTTPSKLAPDSSRHRLTYKGNKTLPSHVKFSITSISSDKLKEDSEQKEDACVVSTKISTSGTSLNKSESSPQSAESIISVDETSDSSTAVIEISEDDSPAPSTASPVRTGFTTKTPQRSTGQKPFTSTPLRTPQSLLKRAIVTSAKKQINSSLRAALGKSTPARQLASTPAHNRNFERTGTTASTPSTPKSRISIGSPGSVAAAQRRNISSLTGASHSREHVITASITPSIRLTQNRKITASASRLNTAKRTSPLRGVRKSFGGTALTSHISKTRRSVISPRKHSPTAIATKLAAKARKSFIPNSPNKRPVASRARSLVAAAMSPKSSTPNSVAIDASSPKRDTTEKEVKKDASLEEQNEVDELSRTFTVDDSLEEVQIKTSNASTACVLDVSTSQKQELNKMFSLEKKVLASESIAAVDLTDDAESSIESQKEGLPEDLNEKSDKIITEHISESFAEVVEANVKTEEKIESLQTQTDRNAVKIEKQNANETVEMSASHSQTEKQADDVKTTAEKSTIAIDNQRESKLIEDQVFETLDAYEINDNISIEQLTTTAEDHVLTPPSSSEKIDMEDMPKQSAESQGTAELLEEIEYVLNKSDELQQQLSKDTHASHIEVTNEFVATIEKSCDETEDVTTKKNTKTDVNINLEINLDIEPVEDSTTTGKDEPTTSSTSNSALPTSRDKIESQENASSTDTNMKATASEITSTDLASLMQTELLSITSITMPSDLEVSTIESSSVEKPIVSDKHEATDENAENINNIANLVSSESKVTENESAIKTECSVAVAVEAETLAEVESTTGVIQETVENDASNEENSVNKSKIDAIILIDTAEILKDSQTVELGKEAKKIHAAVVIKLTESNDNDTQKIDQLDLITTEFKETESVATEFEEYKSVTSKSKVALTPIEDVQKVAEGIKSLSNSSKTITEETTPKAEDQIAAGSERNSDSEKENNIRVSEECTKLSTNTADETKKPFSSEPKTPNLCGVRDMLRTPKQTDSTTPRFVGLRNLMRTPKASTSAAAAAAASEDDTEELLGVQKLLKTPCISKIKADTPQNTAEDSKFTPRRSTRRRASANPELTPTPKNITETDDTPRRTTRRRASAYAEVNYTPQRITRRRSSLALDNEAAADKTLTPIKRGGLHSKRPGTIAETPVAEDMGAIIEEEAKECVQESTEDQQDFVETQKNKETENNVQDALEVIEESICEEVNTQNQDVEEQKEEIVEDKSNNECEKAEKSTSENESICVNEKIVEDVDKVETATESESQPQQTQVQEVAADSSYNIGEVHKEERIQESKDLTADKTAEILDESDYEYGKEVMENSEATASTDALPKTPKTQRKSIKIADTYSEKSPKTPVMIGMRELLRTPKDSVDTPKLTGVRDLVRTPKTIIGSATNDMVDDAKELTGLADLMKTPKATKTHSENIEAAEEDDEPSTSTKAHADFFGMRELLKTPKHTSTPYYSGMRELLRTPKACSTPQLAGVRELMQTPKRTKLDVEYGDKNEELDQFFKTPRAKNIMIPADPASALLEPSSDSSAEIMMAATTEYELHSSSQRPLEEIYKTPVSTRLTSVEIEKDTSLTAEFEVNVPETPAAICANPPKATTSKRYLSAEETFDEMVGLRTTLDETPPQKVYARKQQSIVAVSPFSATDVISDLPKTDIQEWVENLEQESESDVEEQEFTASTSILNASKATHDPIAASAYEISGVNTTEELLADMSAVSSMVDPLQPTATKPNKSSPTIVLDANETLRPVTPINTEMSGINLLDQTNESVFSEPLVVSDTESEQLEENENDKAETETEKFFNKSVDVKKSQDVEEFPIMFIDSSDSEHEEDMKTTEKSDAKKVKVKLTPEVEIIELDDESTANADVTNKPIDIHEEFRNFQLHKNVAGQHIRASTPNRSVMQSTRARRPSMGAEQFITKVSIDVSNEKSRLTKERERKEIDTVVEVDEESEDKVTVIEDDPIETSANATELKGTNPSENKPSATTAETMRNESEFRNFRANKSITSRRKRAATPDQVNKSRSEKIIQGRRLTLGAELHLHNVKINFEEEKLRLEQSKQQTARIEVDSLERDDSFKTDTVEAVATVGNKTANANYVDSAENVEDEEKVDVKTQMDRQENASEVEANILEKLGKEFEKGLDESVQDLETEISVADKNDAQTIANVAKGSAEEPETNVMNVDKIEPNINFVCKDASLENVAFVATSKENNVNKAENGDTAATCSNFERKTITSGNDKPTVTLTIEEENASEMINEAKSEYVENKLKEETESTAVDELTPAGSTKEENNPEVQSTVGIADQEDLEEAPGSAIVEVIQVRASTNKANENITESEDHQVPNNVSLEALKSHEESAPTALEVENKTSSAGDEFNGSDIFDLTEELSNETLKINTTQGVIFDLTEDEVESTAETNTAENTTSYEQKQHDVTESTTVSIASNVNKISEATENAGSESRSAVAYQEIALSKEAQADKTEVTYESEMAEKAVKTTIVEELEASVDEKSPPPATNTSTDNEAFTLVVSAGSELENGDEIPERDEVAPKTSKANKYATKEVPVVKADTNNEVEELNNQVNQANITDDVETEAISQGSATELHSEAADITEEPATTNTKEPTKVTAFETEMESETPTSATLTVNEADTADNKDSNETVRTDIELCIVPEDATTSPISPTTMETELANKETKENKLADQLQTENLAVVTAEITDEAKKETATAAEIVDEPVQTPVNQEKSDLIGDNEEIEAQPSCSQLGGKENNEAEIIPLIIAASTISHDAQETAETLETVSGEVLVNKEESPKKTVVDISANSTEEHEETLELLKENEIAVENIERKQSETPTCSEKQQSPKRRVFKSSKQKAEEEPIHKSTLESKPLIEKKVTAAQSHIDMAEEGKTDVVQLSASKSSKTSESSEVDSKMSVKETSELGENMKTIEKEREISDETRAPLKRRGRKPSRSKQTTEANVDLVSTTTITKTILVEEFSDDNKPILLTSKHEESSSGTVQTKADASVATSTRHKTEPEYYTKVNYEVCISESAETAHDVKTDKHVKIVLPDQSEKLIKDSKYTDHSEAVSNATGQQLASSIELDKEIDATEAPGTTDKVEEVHEPKRTRRTRKDSQSSQCSTHDEDHLPTTTTRRRGGRRRADTPLEHIEVSTSDLATVKRRRQGQDKLVEDKPLEEIQEVQVEEIEIVIAEENDIEANKTSEECQASIAEEHSGDIDNDVKKSDNDHLEAVVRSTTGKEEHVDSEDALIKSSTSRRQRMAKATDEIGDSMVKELQHSDTDELSNVAAATKRGRRKPTLSESSQTSVNSESLSTKRRRRGHNVTSDKSNSNEAMEETENSLLPKITETLQIREDDATTVPALLTTAKAVEAEFLSEAENAVEGNSDAIKTEVDHSAGAESSKRMGNKRTRKASNKELLDETRDIKIEESHDEKVVVEQEQPLKKVAATSRARVNRYKKPEVDDDYHEKTEEPDQVHKDEVTLEKETQNKIEVADQAVVELTNTNADSVGGRRGRRGAAAAATVAINEVSSAHKRNALRGKSHQNKSHATRKEDETNKTAAKEEQSETATDHDEAPTVVDEKHPHKAVRRRRISLKEVQPSHAVTAEEGEGVEQLETDEVAGPSTKVAPKRSRKRRESHHADDPQPLNKSEARDETPTSVPAESPTPTSTKHRSRRKRKDSHQNINDGTFGDEPPKKRPLSRKRRDSSLDSSIHEGTGIDMDTNHGANTSSSSTTPQRPRRAAAAQDRNYDESSDAEAQVDLKRRIEKASLPKASTGAATAVSSTKQGSPTRTKTPTKAMMPAVVAEITAKTTSTPILSTVITTSRGRQRKPTARVQQYLEEERAKAETPKKRLLLASAAIGETPTSQTGGTPARRTRKASTVETERSETVHTMARGRTRTAKVLHVAETTEEPPSEVEHTHSELETTHSSSHVEEKEQTTNAKATKRPPRGRGKQPIVAVAAANVESEIPAVPATTVATSTEGTHTGTGRAGRAAKAAAAAALITDDAIGSHTKARGGRTRRGAITVDEEVQPSDAEVKEVRTEVVVTPAQDVEQTNKKTRKAAAGGRTARGGRGRKKQQALGHATDEHTSQHAADGETSSNDVSQQQPQHPIIADADDEHEDDEETLTTEAADLEVATSLADAKLAGKKRTAATRKAAAATTSVAESPVPKRGRRRAVAPNAEESDAALQLDTRAESAASSRSRKVVRFNAATPSSVASATLSVDTAAEDTEEITSAPTAPAKRATRSRRK
nr:uncharacterized protein LOC106616798 isoform X1 [Bactrocera oleae]